MTSAIHESAPTLHDLRNITMTFRTRGSPAVHIIEEKTTTALSYQSAVAEQVDKELFCR